MRLSPTRALRRLAPRPAAEDVHPDDREAAHEIVEAARRGDRLAFAALYDRYHGVIYRMLRARVGVREDAEDLVAETFIEAWKALPRYRWTGAPFQAWLLAIATSRANSHHRRSSSRPVSSTGGAEELDRLLDGQDEHCHTEQRLVALSLLETLPDEHRKVLALRFYGGLSAEEIGTMLNRRPGTVRQMQMVALERLARHERREQAA